MIKTLLLYIIILPLHLHGSERLDPHEKEGLDLRNYKINSKSNCLICHKLVGDKVEILESINERCISCHNPYPHSGTIEHLGKDLSKLKIGLKGELTCMSCHRPHRAKLETPKKEKTVVLSVSPISSFVLKKRKTTDLPAGLVERKTPNPMLQRECLDCHNMENMP